VDPKADAILQNVGRYLLYFAAVCIPLAFCRETMYIFQLKTFILQYTGFALLVILSLQMWFSKNSFCITKKWAYRLVIFFACWQIFKSWDSISSIVSYRQLSRIIWLPVIAISIPWFFRTRKQIERLITVVVVTALLVNLLTWLLYIEYFRLMIFGTSPNDSVYITDLGFTFLGGFIESFFYPGEYAQFIDRVKEHMFPLTYYSFYPGKPDAGTFGSRNFITAYINLTSALMLYRAATTAISAYKLLFIEKAGNSLRVYDGISKLLFSLLLIITAILSFVHIIELLNRGSWLGLFVATLVAFFYLIWKVIFKRFIPNIKTQLIWVMAFVIFVGAVSTVFLQYDSNRVKSIFSVKSGTNELRRHLWTSYFNAWSTADEEFDGVKGKAWKMLTGMGTYSFRVVYPKYRSQRIFKIEFNQHNTETSHPHNEYIGYLGELGIIGLVCYLLMIATALWRFISKKNAERSNRDALLFAALLFSIVSQLVHQFVGVSIRYTGISFQFWLTLGLILALCWSADELIEKKQTKSVKAMGAFSFVGIIAFLWFAGITYPIQLMRSQHFYEMGQINYGYVRARQQQLQEYQQKYKQMLEMQEQLKKKNQRNPKLDSELPKAARTIELIEKSFRKVYHRADKYFQAGHLYDCANFESIYIGANMNVQFANQALGKHEFKKAKVLFEKALRNYDTVTQSMPYFVQARYWQGVCYKGIATSMIMQMRVDGKDKGALVREKFNLAIYHYNLYDQQDPIYRDSYYDKFYIYLSIKDYKSALSSLRKLLVCYEKGGYFIYNKSGNMRFDPERMINLYIKYAPKKDAIEALELYSQILLYKSVKEMVPFVPMTERHITNSFEFLN